MSFLSHPVTTFIAAEPIPAGSRVKFAAGSAMRVQLAGATDKEIGTAILHAGKSTYPAESEVGVQLIYAGGSRTVRAAGPGITAGSVIYRASDGRVAATGTDIFGYALEASAAANDVIEALFAPSA